jgi:Fe-Mn family superoxide dismutase
MKIKVKHVKCDMSKKDKELMNNFIKFLQKKHPLKDDITIIFTGERFGTMSSGSRTEDSELKILTKGRMNRDIARTLAHEWIHEKQINLQGKKPGQDIGGPLEDEANAKAGSLIKQFEKANPEKEELMYESFNKKIKLLNEQILLTEKEEIKNNLLLEMKKIGIEKLPYAYSALNKFVGTETMDIHYNKHYKGYVKKLNDALSKTNKKYEDLEDIIKSISKFDTKVRNNAGGAFNHALFWKMLSPKKQIPKGEIFEMITKQYGNIKKMKDEFNEIAKERFGSGWVWLVLTKTNRLKIMSTPNQDNPLMNIVKDGGYPLLGLDLWEHAYYLRYRNKRDEYIKKFWNYVNWEFVNELYTSKTKKTLSEANGRFAGLWSNARRINISDDDIDHPDNEPIDDFYKKYPQGSWYNEEGRRAIRAKLSNPDLPILRKLCPSGGYGNNPFCRLNHMSRFLDNDTRVDLEVAMEILSDYFRIKTVGLFPKIVQLALDNDGRTVNYLKLLADFIDDDKFDDTETKKILNKQRNSEKIPSNLEDLLKQARTLEHQSYENKFHGDYFDKNTTFLKLDYKCGDDAKDTLFTLLSKIKSKEKTLDIVYNQIINCVKNSLTNGTYYLKADLVSKKDLKYNDEVIFKSGTYFEVKKMDPFIDSYLSEFFSVFKQTNLSKLRGEHLGVYNELIQRVYEWLISNSEATKYLEKVKSQIGGIIYDYDTIVPMDYIDLYWSNKGQRGCDEKRLSIRFKIKNGINQIKTFKFKNSEELTPITKDVPNDQKKKVICE